MGPSIDVRDSVFPSRLLQNNTQGDIASQIQADGDTPHKDIADAARKLQDAGEDETLRKARQELSRIQEESIKLEILLKAPRDKLFRDASGLYESSLEQAVLASGQCGKIPVSIAVIAGTIASLRAASAFGLATGGGLGLVGILTMAGFAIGSAKIYKAIFKKFVLPRKTENAMRLHLDFRKNRLSQEREEAENTIRRREKLLIDKSVKQEPGEGNQKPTVNDEPEYIIIDGCKLDKKTMG